MAKSTSVNPQVTDALADTRAAVIGDYEATEDIAFMALAQSATTTVQDAAAHLRSTQTVAVAAIAAAFEHMRAGGDTSQAEVIALAGESVRAAAQHFKDVTAAAIEVIQKQPKRGGK